MKEKAGSKHRNGQPNLAQIIMEERKIKEENLKSNRSCVDPVPPHRRDKGQGRVLVRMEQLAVAIDTAVSPVDLI